jgi:hypothetical protein
VAAAEDTIMMSFIPSLSTLSVSYDLPFGALLVASLAAVAAIGGLTQARALFAGDRRPALRPAHSA